MSVDDVSLRLGIDETPDVYFRILPEAWPTVTSSIRPLTLVRTTVDTKRNGRQKLSVGGPKSWDELKAEGAVLGVLGWTDQVEHALDKYQMGEVDVNPGSAKEEYPEFSFERRMMEPSCTA